MANGRWQMTQAGCRMSFVMCHLSCAICPLREVAESIVIGEKSQLFWLQAVPMRDDHGPEGEGAKHNNERTGQRLLSGPYRLIN